MKRSEIIQRLMDLDNADNDPEIFIDHNGYMYSISIDSMHFDSGIIYIPTKELKEI